MFFHVPFLNTVRICFPFQYVAIHPFLQGFQKFLFYKIQRGGNVVTVTIGTAETVITVSGVAGSSGKGRAAFFAGNNAGQRVFQDFAVYNRRRRFCMNQFLNFIKYIF